MPHRLRSRPSIFSSVPLRRSWTALTALSAFYCSRPIVPIGIALFLRQYCGTGRSLRDSVVSTVAALVGMIPAGLVLLTSVVLAVSVIRLARKNALVQELYSIEMLARVDVLCLDKSNT